MFKTQIEVIFLRTKLWGLFKNYVCKINVIQNKLHPKPNDKIVYCCLKNMSGHGIGVRRDTKFQQLLWRKVNILKRNFLANQSNLISKFIFSELKVFFEIPFSKRLTSEFCSIYLYHLGGQIRQTKRPI